MDRGPVRRAVPIVAALFFAAAAGAVLVFQDGIPGSSGRVKQAAVTRATPGAEPAPLREAMFYERREDNSAQCNICFRSCVVRDGHRGFCRNKENRGGTLYNIVHSRPSAVHIDPIEKEPQKHMLPGSDILCIGTAGCNFACRHCQNWHLSQRSVEEMSVVYSLPPKEIVALALKNDLPTISFTYNDPISFYEYVYDTARLAKEKGLKILWHSNAAMQPEALKELLKYTDAVTVDLKGFSQKTYDNFSGELAPVLAALKTIREKGVWLEIVNLVIPTINDSPGEIRKMCEWIKEELGAEVPLHFSRFFPAYRLTNLTPTPIETLERAYRIAKEAGLEYVTLGNVPGHRYNSTFCPRCGKTIIERVHFQVLKNNVKDGKCGFCGKEIPGIWR